MHNNRFPKPKNAQANKPLSKVHFIYVLFAPCCYVTRCRLKCIQFFTEILKVHFFIKRELKKTIAQTSSKIAMQLTSKFSGNLCNSLFSSLLIKNGLYMYRKWRFYPNISSSILFGNRLYTFTITRITISKNGPSLRKTF